MVIGASDQTAIRNFEDRLAAELRKMVVDAVPSYRYLHETGKVAQERLMEAVAKTKAGRQRSSGLDRRHQDNRSRYIDEATQEYVDTVVER